MTFCNLLIMKFVNFQTVYNNSIQLKVSDHFISESFQIEINFQAIRFPSDLLHLKRLLYIVYKAGKIATFNF